MVSAEDRALDVLLCAYFEEETSWDRFQAELNAGRALPASARLARDLGTAQIVLETGVRQPEAVRFYEREGFTEIPRYPPWRMPSSR